MREAVVILPPDVRGQQVIQRGDRPPPRDLPRHLQPLGVLIEHRVDDVHERLVGVEQPVPAGQQIAFEPALALVLAQHLHHAALAAPDGRRPGCVSAIPLPLGRLEHVAQPVRDGLVRAEEAEVARLLIGLDDIAQEASRARAYPPRRRRRARGTSTAYSRKSGSARSLSSSPPLACGFAPIRRAPSRRKLRQFARAACRRHRTAPRGR